MVQTFQMNSKRKHKQHICGNFCSNKIYPNCISFQLYKDSSLYLVFYDRVIIWDCPSP